MDCRRVIALTLLSLACANRSGSEGGEGAWVGTITTEGNVTTVVNGSGSVWGRAARLVEEATIGEWNGEYNHYTFGHIGGVVASKDRIYVVDSSVPIVRMYDFAGRHLKNLGGLGSGPGEYRSANGIGVADDGRVFVQGGRVLVYSPEGTVLETWSSQRGYSPQHAITVTGSGEYFEPILIAWAEFAVDWKWGMQQYNGEGAIGPPVAVPDLAFSASRLEARSDGQVLRAVGVPFGPDLHWRLAPTGTMVAGTSERYGYEVHHSDGAVTIVSKSWEVVPVPDGAARAAELEVYETFRRQFPEWQWDGPAIPDTMPAYSALVPDKEGRVWVQSIVGTRLDPECDLEGRGRRCWQDVIAIDAFGADGRYLGRVDAPSVFRLDSPTFIQGTTVVAATTDEAGTNMVKRYRLVLPSGDKR